MKLTIDRPYYASLIKIAAPIAIQNGFNSLLAMLDVLMIGQLGETSVAAAALANQISFLFMLTQFGITSGAAVFSAQFWGKKDIISIRKVLGICLVLAFSAASLFTLVAEIAPAGILGLYTQDPAVISLGSRYLQLVGWSYLFACISSSFTAVLKGMGQVRLPMAASVTALVLKALISYVLIFGHLGLPAMGVLGGAIGTLIARSLEFGLMLLVVYLRRAPAAAHPRELLGFNRVFALSYLKVALPVVLNEIFWASGVSLYSAIYAHISTGAIAAINIAATVDNLAFVLLIATSDAAGILTGNQIGAGNSEIAFRYARRSLINATVIGLLIGVVIISISGIYPNLYQLEAEVREYVRMILVILGFIIWIRGSNFTLIVAIMRAGGDTRIGALIDVSTVWLIGLPMALIGAYLLHLPIWGVYLMVAADEFTKYLIGLRRFFSRRWIHNLATIGE